MIAVATIRLLRWTARRLAAGPAAATVLDEDALAALSELGLVAT